MSMKTTARDIVMSIGLIATFLASFLAVAPYVIDGAMIRDQLVSRVAAWSGGTVEVRGGVYITSMFELKVEAHDVSLNDPARFDGLTSASAEKVEARLSVWDLINGELIFEKIWIDGLEARLAQPVDADWRDLFSAKAPLLRRVMAEAEDAPFMTVVVRDGQLLAPTPEGETVSAVGRFRSVVELAPDGAGMDWRANFTWRGEQVAISVERGAFEHVADVRSAPVEITARVAGGEVEANGNVRLGENVGFEGRFAAEFADVSRLASLLGQHVGPQNDALEFAAEGSLRADEREIGFFNFRSSLGRMSAKGMLSIDRSKPRLQVTTTLDLGSLDLLAAYAGAQALGMADGAQIQARDTRAPSQGSVHILDALLPLGAPAAFDGELRLSASRLSAPGLYAGPAAIFISLQPQGLTADLAELGLFGGTMNGQFELSRDAAGLVLRGRGSAESLSMRDCLWGTPAQDWMSGEADATFQVESRGPGLAALWAATRLKANLVAVDGGALGVDVAALLEQGESLSAAQGQTEVVLPPSPRGRGSFDIFSARIEVTSGGVKVDALEMTAGTWSATGAGEIAFAQGWLNWKLQAARVENSIESQSLISFAGGQSLLGRPLARLDIQGDAERPEIRYIAPKD